MWGTGYFRTVKCLHTFNLSSGQFENLKIRACFICDSAQHSSLSIYLHCEIKFRKQGSGYWLISCKAFHFPQRNSFFILFDAYKHTTINCTFVLCYIFYFMLHYPAVKGTSWAREVALCFCRNSWKFNHHGTVWSGQSFCACHNYFGHVGSLSENIFEVNSVLIPIFQFLPFSSLKKRRDSKWKNSVGKPGHLCS